MKNLIFLLAFFCFAQTAQSQISYSGNVLDSFDKKYLEGVSVSISGKESVLTNSRGYFSIQGMLGDTLLVRFPGFYDQKVILSSDRFLLLQIQDQARLLPTFQVDAEPYRFRFVDGKLVLYEEEDGQEKSLSQQVGMEFGTPGGGGGLTILGPISYFSKRNAQLRRYALQMEWTRRRQGYLEIIDSDSVRTSLMTTYKLNREQWDQIVQRFNEFHLQHEFLDWPKERVATSLEEFIRIESEFLN